jgi:antitoxin (DNA-binding transcriptional repressor) of toxin-antitoxin stability system
MQSITLRQLRDTRKVKAWLRAGVHIEVRERNEVIGDLVPRTPPSPNPSNGLISQLARKDLR